jgi:hypothetical protein
MEDLARRENKSHWLQKTDPWQAYGLLEVFRDAVLVVIERDIFETLRSLHYMRSHGQERLRIKTILGYLLQQKVLRRVRQRADACVVQFDRLKADPAGETERVCRHLDLPFEPSMVESRYRANTSFREGRDRDYRFTALERLKIRIASAMAGVLPFPLLSLGRSLFGAKELHYVKGTFASIKDRYGLD